MFPVLSMALAVLLLAVVWLWWQARCRLRGEAEKRAWLEQQERAGAQRTAAHQKWLLEAVQDLVSEQVPAVLEGRKPAARPRSAGADPVVAAELARVPGLVEATVAEHREVVERLLVSAGTRVSAGALRIQAAADRLAERVGADSELLAAVLGVDHAATRLAREGQNWSVLGGGRSGVQWTRPLSLIEAVQGAQGRVEEYARIESSGDERIGVRAGAAEALMQVLAELMANATACAPSSTPVSVHVATAAAGAVIQLDDRGLGMADAELTAAQRRVVSAVDLPALAEAPRLGLAVVGALSRRHGFRVGLEPSPYGGIRAVVLVPRELLETVQPAAEAVATARPQENDHNRLAAQPAGGLPQRRRARSVPGGSRETAERGGLTHRSADLATRTGLFGRGPGAASAGDETTNEE